MRNYAVYFVILSVFLFNGCTKPNPDEVKKLSTEIEKVNLQIKEAKKDIEKYGEGSALHAMVSLRLSVFKQTQAMLEQKKVSSWYFPKSSYTINGQIFSPPEKANELIPKLENEIVKARDEWKISQGKAESAGGLLRAFALMETEVKSLRVAQLEYQLSAYKNGYPPLYPKIDTSKLSSPVSTATEEIKKKVHKSSAKKIESKPTKYEIDIETMKKSVFVKLLNKTYYPSDWESGRYEDNLRLEFQYKNSSGKDIRAFTGFVTFMDIFEREFLNVNLTVDTLIPSGKSLNDSDKSLKINNFSDVHKKLVATDMENLKTKFTPVSILFKDGTKLGTTNQ